MGNLYAAVAFISGLYLLGNVQMHANLADYPFSCSVLLGIVLILGLVVAALLILAIRSVMRGMFHYATA